MTGKPWVAAIHRLLKAEPRPDPRPKPGHKPGLKFWNGADLAEAAKIRPNTLSDAMTGKREPGAGTLLAIAEALQVPPAALLMDADEAEAYLRFRQNHTATTQNAAMEETVRRVLEQRAEQMKADWLATQTQSVMSELNGAPPAPETKEAPRKKSA